MADLIGRRLGNYEISQVLGEGGMASVYRARQINMGRDVAIKVIKTSANNAEEFTLRFEREARTVAALNHPHILKVFDFGQQDDLAYLVMELQPGGSLAELIAAGPLPIARATQVLEHVGSALDYAHRQGLVHRDLKPQNILFDSDGNAILADFGIAKLLGDGNTMLTQAGVAIGTPIYMAPELWQGIAVDGRADTYALGVVLFQMLSGVLPFSGDTPFSIMHKHIYELPPAVVGYRTELSTAVDQVIQKALAKDRTQRYNTASEMVQDFKTALITPASVVVPPPVPPTVTPSPTLQRPPEGTIAVKRSSPLTLIIGIVAVIVLMIGGGLFAVATRPTPAPSPTTIVAALPTASPVTPVTPLLPTATMTSTATVVTIANSATASKVPPTITPVPTSSGVPTTAVPTVVPEPTATRADTGLILQTALAQALTQTATQWTPTKTLTPMPSVTPTNTVTATPSVDVMGTAFQYAMLTGTAAIKIAALNTQMALPTASLTTYTTTLSPTARPSASSTWTLTSTASFTATAKPSNTPTFTVSPSSTSSKTPLPTDTPLPTNSNTPKPTATSIPTKSSTPTPTITPSPTLPGYHPPLDILAVTLTARAEGTPGAGATDTPFYNGDPLLPNNMKVVFWDSLYSNSYNWQVYSKPDVGTLQIVDNALQFALKPLAYMSVMVPMAAPAVTDFYFRTLVSYVAPPVWATTSIGVIIHRSDAGYDFIDIRPGSCLVALNTLNSKTSAVATLIVKNACQTGSQLKSLPSFVLTLVGSNNQFTVYVNDIKEAVLADTTKSYTSGALGIYTISSQTNGFNVAFTDIAVGQ